MSRTTRSSRRWIAALLLASAAAWGCGSPRAKHVVLITVDTLRADRIGVYGYAAAKTPALDSLAGKSIRFERAYSHASLTEPSLASILTGELPARHGVAHNQNDLRSDVRTLAERLRAAGFRTAAFIGSYVLRPGHGLERGFDHYTDRFVSKELLRQIPENPGGVLSDDAVAWAGSQQPDQRLFVWIHYQEPHGPYTPKGFHAPPGIQNEPEIPMSSSQSGRDGIPRYQWLGHGRLAEYLLRYDAEVSEVDWFVGVLLRGLREKGILDDSIVLFTADHGEAFGEDGLYCAHGEGLGEVLLRVPLLLHVPGEPPAVRRDAVRQIDVAPTLLALLGVEADGLPGQSLLSDVGDRRVISQAVNVRLGPRAWRGIREGGVAIVEEEGGTTVAHADGAAGDDGVPAEVQARLRAELERESPWPVLEARPLSPKEQEALRALGYAE